MHSKTTFEPSRVVKWLNGDMCYNDLCSVPTWKKKSQKFFVILVQLHISNGEKSFSFFSNIGKIAKVEEKKNDS